MNPNIQGAPTMNKNHTRLGWIVCVGLLTIACIYFVTQSLLLQESTLNQPIQKEQFAAPQQPSNLNATRMVLFPDQPLTTNENHVYCPVIKLLWPDFKEFVGTDLADDPIVDRIDSLPFSKADIKQDHYFSYVGPRDDQLLVDGMQEYGLDPNLLASDVDYENVAFAALKKHLPFDHKFERFEEPLKFATAGVTIDVVAFGVTSDWDQWKDALEQIKVLHYGSPDDFIIKLRNTYFDDLILAKVPQPKSITDGIQSIKTKIESANLSDKSSRAAPGEQVSIPVLEISLIEEFTNKITKATSRIRSARQLVMMNLNESGAELKASVFMGLDNGHYNLNVGQRTFIFDKPFMIMMQEYEQQNPYFAAWIANTDFMLPE